MNKKAIQILKNVITKWLSEKRYTFENKQVVHCYESQITKNESIITFSNSIEKFRCNGELIPIKSVSKPFHTNTISNNPISQNLNGDKDRLEKFLQKFDEDFYKEVENKLDNCIEKFDSSDPIFF